MPYLQQRTASPVHASSSLRLPRRQPPGPHITKEDLHQNSLHRRQGLKRTPLNQWYVQNSEILGRGQTMEFGAMGRKGDRLDSRSPKHHKSHHANQPTQTSQQKKVDAARKLLNDDLAKEKKAQDKAAAKALKSVNKAQGKAQKSTAKELKHEQKEAAKDQARIDKAKAKLAKEEANKGKKGKAGKAYAKAEKNYEKANGEMAKHHSDDAKKMQGIDGKETSSIDKAGTKLAKGQKKAHTDQFGDKGARIAREHPTAWQRFKRVMAKIGNAIDWAITGISLLVPGAEEEGLARLTAKGAEMIAEKAAKKGVKEGAKKGVDAANGQLQKQQQHQEVVAAKTESDAQVAAAQANAQKGTDEFNQARQKAAHPAAGYHRRSSSTSMN